jgi:hypothetical protein
MKPRFHSSPQLPRIHGLRDKRLCLKPTTSASGKTSGLDSTFPDFSCPLKIRDNSTFLDVGCGSGYVNAYVARCYACRLNLGLDLEEAVVWGPTSFSSRPMVQSHGTPNSIPAGAPSHWANISDRIPDGASSEKTRADPAKSCRETGVSRLCCKARGVVADVNKAHVAWEYHLSMRRS